MQAKTQQVHGIFPIGTVTNEIVFLNITGNDFDEFELNNEAVYCQYYSDDLPIQQNFEVKFISKNTIICETPRTRDALIYEITIIGKTELKLKETFMIYEKLEINSINPLLGNIRGGTTMTVKLKKRFNGYLKDYTYCKFGNRKSKILYISDLEFKCKTPEINNQRNATIRLSQNEGVTNENTGLKFQYYDKEPNIQEIEPNEGSILGGTNVLLKGDGFKFSLNLKCKFHNSYSISARFINSNVVSCVSPPSSERNSEQNVTISFSPNGVDFYEYSNLTYFYKSTCPPYEDDIPPCFGRGTCKGTKCICNENFNGIACENCIKTCNFNGICSNFHGNCDCFPGFYGAFCEFQYSICGCIPLVLMWEQVRAGIVNTKNGKIIQTHEEKIKTFNPLPLHYEQSSNDIWNSISISIQKILQKTKIKKQEIVGIGFDATCSLVAIDSSTNQPISISTTKENEQNVILWMDHRSLEQTKKINSSKNEVLKYVGENISPEMEIPKLLWIKENIPDLYQNENVNFFDLADWLVYKATGDDTRSVNTLVAKWTYLSHKSDTLSIEGWNDEFFKEIGLEYETKLNYKRIGNKFSNICDSVGNGLTKESAENFNLNENTIVTSGIIDAHAGGIGMLGSLNFKEKYELNERLSVIGGTSSCLLSLSTDPIFVKGVWGPFYSGMIEKFWFNEGGQSISGKLIEYLITNHPYYLTKLSKDEKSNIFEILNKKLKEKDNYHKITSKLNIYPDFHGNRSPLSNPNLKGMICGLELNQYENFDDFLTFYLSIIQAICYSTGHIIQEMNQNGHKINSIFICGGLSKNDIFVQEISNVTKFPVYLPNEEEIMILGSSILASVASKQYDNIFDAMKEYFQIS
eukprot:gene5787-9608_t